MEKLDNIIFWKLFSLNDISIFLNPILFQILKTRSYFKIIFYEIIRFTILNPIIIVNQGDSIIN